MLKVSKELFENQTIRQDATQAAFDIADCLREDSLYPDSVVIAISAYLLHEISCFCNPLGISYQDILDGKLNLNEDILFKIKERLNEHVWEKLQQLVTKYSTEALAVAALVNDPQNIEKAGMVNTPESVVKLAQSILAIKPNDSVADICCGAGSFIVSSALDEPKAHYYGVDINVDCKMTAAMRSALLDAEVEVVLTDAFALADCSLDSKKYNKIFSNYPFGMKLRNLGLGAKFLADLAKEYPGVSKATSSDWVFNALLCDLLAENGRAIGIMTNGSTWNGIDEPMRKLFVEQGLVECVISLPARMFYSTNIPTTMIVLSHGNNSVRLVDATKICQQGRRNAEFSEKDIATIVEAASRDSEYSKMIELSELRENEYTLSLSRYLKQAVTFDYSVSFGDVIKSVSRGAPITAAQLDDMVSDDITNMQYLMLANIRDGMIDDKLPYLSHIDPKFDKYCLKDSDLILSKNGYPYKIAVARINDGQRILANGNLYIIELDTEKINPFYLKAFFESELGIATLKSITVGATIPNIGVDKLKRVSIPLPPMEEQRRIAERYQATLDEISILKLKIEKATNRLHHIFDEESGD